MAWTLIPALLLNGAAGMAASAAETDADLATVAQRLRDYYLTVNFFGDGANVEVCTVDRAGDYLAAQNADGSWSDVDYACTESAANGVAWSPYLALDRMQAMAVAYSKPDHPAYHSAAMLDGVERALLHWVTVRGKPEDAGFVGPWSVNWWENSIGIQLRFGRIGLFLKDELSAGALAVITDKLQKEGDSGTGQNSLWFNQNALFRALITEDSAQFAKAAALMNAKMTVQLSADSQEAVQVDGSYHGHGELFMTHFYGMALFRDMSLWAYVLRDTAFALADDTIRILSDYMLNGSRWSIRGEVMELACGYTPCGEGGYAYTYYTEPIRRMMALDEANRGEYQILLDNILGLRADNGLSGFHYMWTSAYASQMREGYGVNVRMDSSTIKGAEWRANWGDGPDYGNLVFWTTAGAVTVTVDGDEYRSVYPTYDWRHTPGVTAPFELSTRTGAQIANDMAMGVDSGDYGATGFSYLKNDGRCSTRGKVGYFVFEDEYVALGAGISSNSAVPVHTTLNQTKAADPQTAAGAIASGTDGAAVAGQWVYNNKIGYVFPEETTVHVSSLDQSAKNLPTLWGGTYSQFSIDNVILDGTYTVTDDTFSLWIDHGGHPADASYAYIVVPNRTAEETAAYAAAIPITILANNERVQAVRHEGLRQTQVNFYEAGAVLLDENTVLTADAPCSVVVDRSGETVLLTAGIPNNAASSTLTLSLMEPAGTTVTDFTFAPAPYTGESITLPAGENTACGGMSALFDGDETTAAAVTAGKGIVRDFGATVYLSGCSVRCQTGASRCLLEGSEDGHNWTALGSVSGGSTLPLNSSWRYVRLTPSTDGVIAEITLTARNLDYANRTNVAQGRAVTVSGTNVDTMAKECAVDGDPATRWASNRSGAMWIYVDLGQETDIDAVRLLWELAYAKTYIVDVSSDAVHWTTVMTVENPGGTQQHLMPPGTVARYIRVNSLQALNQYGINLWELEVYAREDATTEEVSALQTLTAACRAMDAAALSAAAASHLAQALEAAEAALQPPYSEQQVAQALAGLTPAAETAAGELAAARLSALREQAAHQQQETVTADAWRFFVQQREAAAALPVSATAAELTVQADRLEAALAVLADNPAAHRWGDVNGDGAVDTTDARLTLQYAAKRLKGESLRLAAADVNADGAVDTTDARLILQHAAKRIKTFPAEK